MKLQLLALQVYCAFSAGLFYKLSHRIKMKLTAGKKGQSIFGQTSNAAHLLWLSIRYTRNDDLWKGATLPTAYLAGLSNAEIIWNRK